jgi:hypothetical protein
MYYAQYTGRFKALVQYIRRILVRSSGTENVSKSKKSKAVPLHAMEAHGVRGGIAPTHS